MDEAAPDNRARWAWLGVLLGLVAWQAWMTLTLFGPDRPWDRLLDEQPIISGRHPLHLYHGCLGAESLYQRGTLCCFDPAFHSGYLKTPVFDSGSRPAELFLSLAGGKYRPAAYKLGLLACCCLVPLLLALAAWGVGLGGGATCLATALGLLVWWGGPCRDMLEAGDLDLLLAALAALAQVGLLANFHRAPGLIVWIALLLSGCLGWFTQPLLFPVVVGPLLLLYYLSAGPRHGIGWHLALFAGIGGGIVVNLFWLVDWVEYWWIQAPLPVGVRFLTHRTLQSFWEAAFWGSPEDRALAVLLFASAVVGIFLFSRTKRRRTARLLAVGAAGMLVLALLGIAWEPSGRLGTPKLLVPALWFALVPAVYGWVECGRLLCRWTGSPWRAAPIICGLLLVAGGFALPHLQAWAVRCRGTTPLAIGLSPDRKALVELLRQHTDSQARILWEDRTGQPATSRWTALLPILTERVYLSGLDPTAAVEHAYASFADQNLAGRPIASWTDNELEEFCRRYNVGWVVCWSPAARERFQGWAGGPNPRAELTASFQEAGQGGDLYTLKRTRSFVLKGQARWLQADRGRIELGEVTSEDGRVVLSLHYQRGMVASPSRVQIERDPDPMDPIPFVRLRIPGLVTRVTLTWAEP